MLFDITSHSNSHFAIGINAVLIPQSIFTNSYLNRLVQQKDVTNMPRYLKEADFSGIGEDSSITEHIEGIISVKGYHYQSVYYGLSGTTADRIVKLALANATDKDSRINTLVRTDSIEDYNVANDVLLAIPFAGISNGDVASGGDLPTTGFLGWLSDQANMIINAFVSGNGVALIQQGLIALGKFLEKLIDAIVEFGMRLIGAIEDAINAVKDALAIIILIAAEIARLFATLSFQISLNSIGSLFELIPVISLNNSDNGIEFGIGSNICGFEVRISDRFVPTFEMSLPYIEIDLNLFTGIIHISQGLISLWDLTFDFVNNQNIQSKITSKSNQLKLDSDTKFDLSAFQKGLAIGNLGNAITMFTTFLLIGRGSLDFAFLTTTLYPLIQYGSFLTLTKFEPLKNINYFIELDDNEIQSALMGQAFSVIILGLAVLLGFKLGPADAAGGAIFFTIGTTVLSRILEFGLLGVGIPIIENILTIIQPLYALYTFGIAITKELNVVTGGIFAMIFVYSLLMGLPLFIYFGGKVLI